MTENKTEIVFEIFVDNRWIVIQKITILFWFL